MSLMKLSHWHKWALTTHRKGVKIIRRYRYVNERRVWETYPKHKYADFSPQEVEALVRRLNASREQAELEAKKRFEYDHAFINTKILDQFERMLRTRANKEERIKTQLSMLHNYVCRYFVHTIKITDPDKWKKYESGFGEFLLQQKIGKDTIKRIIQTANRFLKFLHNAYPEEVRMISLDPVSLQVLKNITSKNTGRAKYINETDFDRICAQIDARILPMVKLAYTFGLRRAETLGLSLDCVFEDGLAVERQLVKVEPAPQYDQLKGKENRFVPYWNCTANDAYEWISEMGLLHPDTITHLFDAAMVELKFEYQFHDLRRTFISNSLRTVHYLDVRLAAGHKDLKTTQGYIQDDRQLQRKKFKPKLKTAR